MIAKFSSICCFCSTKIEAGRDEYDPDTKKSWHLECWDNQPPSLGQIMLAETLGFKRYTWEELYRGMKREV